MTTTTRRRRRQRQHRPAEVNAKENSQMKSRCAYSCITNQCHFWGNVTKLPKNSQNKVQNKETNGIHNNNKKSVTAK